MVAATLSPIERALMSPAAIVAQKPIPGVRKKSAKAQLIEDMLWARWPTPERWPGILSVDEAAAYLRVSSDYIRDVTTPGRDGRAQLRHQNLPGKAGRRGKTMKRIRKADLDSFELVGGRASTANK